MEPIRILLVDMPRLLREIVRESILAQSDMEIVGELAEDASLAPAVDASRAEFVIFGTDMVELPLACRDLLKACPMVRVLAVAGDGRRTSIHELRPHKEVLGDVSPPRLVEVIRAAAHDSRGGWFSP